MSVSTSSASRNWLRTLGAIPAWWEAQRKALYAEMGDPVADEKMLYEVSPVFHAAKIKKPLIVLQGVNDPRVLKAESDDTRASLSYQLRKLLSWSGARVLGTAPYVDDPRLVSLECVLEESDVLVLGAPHNVYRDLKIGGKDVVDVWGALGEGIRL